MKTYNRQQAVAYALRYALSPNPNYFHFAGLGGDCTNFISQCLLAGGGTMQYSQNGWYYNSASDRAPSWTSVTALQEFLLNPSLKGPKAQLSTLEELEIGDIIQLRQNPNRFNHSLIVTKIQNSQIYVCAHSNDALNRKLTTYNYYEILPLHIYQAN